jgi:ribosomal protein S18 acetylase RimI-like enzyme
LHVFATNERARRLYERAGFDGELLRYIKRFRDDALS